MSKKFSMGLMKVFSILAVFSLLASVSIFSPRSVLAQEEGTPVVPADVIARASRMGTLPTNQIIIQYKAQTEAFVQPDQAAQMQRLTDAAGVSLKYARAMSGDAHVLSLPGKLSLAEVQAIAAKLSALPDVAYAEPDAIKQHTLDSFGGDYSPALLTPNDPKYGNQWPLKGAWGIDAPAAWDITTGVSTVNVAVIDTGITSHAEFVGRTVPGYDFIADALVGNDGNGRDANPSDPGDWITAADSAGLTYGGWFEGCYEDDSSWHGTHTAGTIGAAGNNGLGVAGINWKSKILPVRVLGKCGGYTSDIVDGMRWSAGLAVAGVPANAHPAKVLSISLGGSGACSVSEQSAINAVMAAGSVIVISAGNSASNVSGFSPANCNGVITVAATGPTGDLTYYSNYGAGVEISAPGGEMNAAGDPNGVLSTLNTGLKAPVADTYKFYQGTSMSAPHVSGVVSLLFSINPNLTPTQILSILQGSVQAFPGGAVCNTSICGSGILDADGALNKAIITISGNVGAAGAKLSYVNGTAKIVTADGSGNYSFDVPYRWSGTVTPSDVDYTFLPVNKVYTTVVNDQLNQNYTASPIWTISGNAGVAGATLSYTDGTAKTATANGNGGYSLRVSDNYTGAVTVSRAGYTFVTNSINYTNVSANMTGQNYTPNQTVHRISGSAGMVGVTMSYNDGSAQTVVSDASGNYALLVPDNFAAVITPSKPGFAFSPSSKSYASTPVTADLTNQDYTATVTLLSSAANDGWLLESTETSGVAGTMDAAAQVFNLGDDATDRQYRAILSFDTSALPDTAVITSAALKIKQNGPAVGTNPFTVLTNLWADIRQGPFGTGLVLQLGDFDAAPSFAKAAVFNPTAVGNVYTAYLNASGLANISKTGATQFRLAFITDDNNNNTADYIKVLSGNSATGQPALVITFTLP